MLGRPTVVKTSQLTTVNDEYLWGWLPHNMLKIKFGYKSIEIINCQTRFNEDLEHDCTGDHIDYIWVDNKDQYPRLSSDGKNYLYVVEPTFLGYHIVSHKPTSTTCITHPF